MKFTMTILALCLAPLCLGTVSSADANARTLSNDPAATTPAVRTVGLDVKWKAPTSCLRGGPYNVRLELTAPAGGAVVAGWLLTPAAFTIGGKELAKREDKGSMTLPEGAKITAEIDLGPYISAEGDFELVYTGGMSNEAPVAVKSLVPGPTGLNFMSEASVSLADLKKYNVLLQTNRGDLILEFWPEVAPNHVRNFLDLSYTNFYVGTTFHRVMPDFMIQGGDPTGTGGGNGPRMLPAEFSDKKHERGVLSMARTDNPNSASCQFFIMRMTKTHLDGQYSAFGKLIGGYDTLDAIATTPASATRPLEPQKILKATVILATQQK